MISLSRVLLVATLLRGINGAAEATDALRSSRLAPHKPFNTGNKPQTMIRGLLGLRQVSCYPGCCNTLCCSTGDSCCSLSGGYGPSYYCSLNGCSGCVNEGDFPCSDGDGCCPDGDTCYRDSSNIGRCRAPVSAGGGGPNSAGFDHVDLVTVGALTSFTFISLVL